MKLATQALDFGAEEVQLQVSREPRPPLAVPGKRWSAAPVPRPRPAGA